MTTKIANEVSRARHKRQVFDLLFRRRVTLLLVVLSFVMISGIFLVYPKTSLVVGVQRSALSSDGELRGPYKKIKEHLAKYGVTLNYEVQPDEFSEKPNLEFLVNHPKIDWVIHPNTGAPLPQEIADRFRSVGIIDRSPIFFYRKSDQKTINKIKDLKGATIVFRSSPEGNDRLAFTLGGAKPSAYSTDYLFSQIFERFGITPENVFLTNTWPDPIVYEMDWDVAMTTSWPLSDVLGSRLTSLAVPLATNRVELLNLEDIEAITRNSRSLELFRINESQLFPAQNIPPHDVWIPAYTQSVAVRQDLDPSLVMLLAEALQQVFSEETSSRVKGEFPTFSKNESFAPHPAADSFYKTGRPFLSNYVSPSAAAFITKLLLVLVPFLTIAWPLAHFFPSIYSAYVRHKINHWYLDLELIERSYRDADSQLKQRYRDTLDEISDGIASLRLPIMHGLYVQDLFIAREHVELIRKKIGEISVKEA